MVSQGVIKLTKAKCASPIFFAPKKDCSIHFCVYYQMLNFIIILHSYLTPQMVYSCDYLGDEKLFTMLDVNCVYFQVDIDEAGLGKKNFTSHHVLYRFIVIPFGFNNAPGNFQRSIDVILSKNEWNYELIYF